MATTLPAKTTSNAAAPDTTKTPARVEPLDLFSALQEEMERFFRPFGIARPSLAAPLKADMQLPRTDIFEQDGNLIVNAELPGIKKDDINIALEQGDLVIRAEHSSKDETKEKDYYRMERRSGSFYRRVPVPFAIQPEQVTAKYTDGVLEVRLPKPVEKPAEKKQIAVQ